MQFIDALEHGTTEFGSPDKVITTLVSKIFIFEEKVLKVYKHEPFFFADLLDFESRKTFYVEDFFWNNMAAPEIYLHFWGIQEREGAFKLVPPSMGEDFVIEMSKIDDTKTLTKLLINSELTKDHAEAFIETTIDILAVLTKERREQLSHLFDKSLAEIMRENIQSLHTWMLGQAPKVPKEDSDNIFELLSKALENEPYFTNIETNGLSVAIDSNCDNLILLNGKPSFIDIMPPMIVWRVVDEYMTVSRLIVDIEALGSKELGDATRAAYAKYQRNLPPIARLAHELRAAGIQWPYRYMLKQDDLAEKFGQYTRAKMAELRALLAQTS